MYSIVNYRSECHHWKTMIANGAPDEGASQRNAVDDDHKAEEERP